MRLVFSEKEKRENKLHHVLKIKIKSDSKWALSASTADPAYNQKLDSATSLLDIWCVLCYGWSMLVCYCFRRDNYATVGYI